MSQTPTNAAPVVEGAMFLFRKPELLTKEAHGAMGITKPDQPYAFCATARAIPITITEMTTAMKDYPIIFSNQEGGMPLAVVGLIEDTNLFVNEEGNWEAGTYVPGYVRRYPFALATEKDGADPEGQRMAMIVDAEYEGLTTSPTTTFFGDDGPSDAMKQAMEFCQNFERDRIQTIRFGEALKPYDLLTEQFAQYTPEGQSSQPFARYNGVDEKRLQDLPDDKFLELRKSGILPLLYAQLMSMSNWGRILDRRAKRFNLSGMDVLNPRVEN